MAEESSYISFISYRHLPLDMQAARKIQKKIENYIVPKEFREQFGGKNFVTYGTGSFDTFCIIIDSEGWEKIGEFIGDSVVFDKDTGKVFSIDTEEEIDSSLSYSVVTHPLYDIAALKEFAESVVR